MERTEKPVYETAEMEILLMQNCDIICTSPSGFGEDGPEDGGFLN